MEKTQQQMTRKDIRACVTAALVMPAALYAAEWFIDRQLLTWNAAPVLALWALFAFFMAFPLERIRRVALLSLGALALALMASEYRDSRSLSLWLMFAAVFAIGDFLRNPGGAKASRKKELLLAGAVICAAALILFLVPLLMR